MKKLSKRYIKNRLISKKRGGRGERVWEIARGRGREIAKDAKIKANMRRRKSMSRNKMRIEEKEEELTLLGLKLGVTCFTTYWCINCAINFFLAVI